MTEILEQMKNEAEEVFKARGFVDHVEHAAYQNSKRVLRLIEALNFRNSQIDAVGAGDLSYLHHLKPMYDKQVEAALKGGQP